MLTLHESAHLPPDPALLAGIERIKSASSRPDGPELLRAEILKGTIRVTPGGGRGNLKFLPTSRLGTDPTART